LDLLINNAGGVALGGNFDQVLGGKLRFWLMSINLTPWCGLCRAFLPLPAAASRAARIVNLSSLFGLVNARVARLLLPPANSPVAWLFQRLRLSLQARPWALTVSAHPAAWPRRLPPSGPPHRKGRVRRRCRTKLARAASAVAHCRLAERPEIILRGVERDKATGCGG